jgi:hypothetical protein
MITNVVACRARKATYGGTVSLHTTVALTSTYAIRKSIMIIFMIICNYFLLPVIISMMHIDSMKRMQYIHYTLYV